MRLRHIKGAEEEIAESPYVVQEPKELKGKWHEFFGNNNPIRIEVGMGKGKFIMETAMKNPDINYVAVEVCLDVIIIAMEKVKAAGVTNVRFINFDAKDICEVFEESEIDRIYLNFSDPWPKERHAKRRLTYRGYLYRYFRLLKPHGRICFKTDNVGLFDYSLSELDALGLTPLFITRDLHHSPYMEGNVMTEYEKNFSEKGFPIHKWELACPPASRLAEWAEDGKEKE